MPLTFIDIERQKNWRIAVFFAVLVLVYLAVVAVLGIAFAPFLLSKPIYVWTRLFPLAILIAGIHFWFSASDAVSNVVRSLEARPPDPDDSVHRMFGNIMEELHVVTGNKKAIRCAVIPSLSLNALAAADLKGNALIAITEGLLSRLTRPQVEAVVAHEAHHILSGDCLESTVAASLFGTLSSAVEKFRSSRGYAMIGLLLAWALLQLGNILNLFISREREYRADAASVRMTRNPLALAETLHLLSRSWRGAGFIGSGFETLCIVNPVATVLDEREGFLADLLSTHPPLRKRMEILLGMARVSVEELDRKAGNAGGNGREAPAPAYFAMSPRQQWQGPYTMQELGALSWLSPLTWISAGDGQPVDRAWKVPLISEIFVRRLAEKEQPVTDLPCPVCRQPLITASYEGTQLFHCGFCAGTLVETARIPRIIARTGKEHPCTERINALAKTVLRQNQSKHIYQKRSGKGAGTVPNLSCPKCRNPLLRGFYSQSHLVEIDRCSSCGLTWFDQDELAMLQCMIENRLAPELPDAAPLPAGTSASEPGMV